jgi:hypothetical protein
MVAAHLRPLGRYAPHGLVEIELVPLSKAKLARTREQKRLELQTCFRRWLSFKTVYKSESLFFRHPAPFTEPSRNFTKASRWLL